MSKIFFPKIGKIKMKAIANVGLQPRLIAIKNVPKMKYVLLKVESDFLA